MTDRPLPLPGEPEIPPRFTYEQLFQRVAAEYIVRVSLIDSNRRRNIVSDARVLSDEIKFRQLADLLNLIEESPELKSHISEVARHRRPLPEKIAETFPTNPDAQNNDEATDDDSAA